MVRQPPSPQTAEVGRPGRWQRLERRQAIIKGLLLGATVISCGSVLAILGFLSYFALPIFSQGHLAEILSWEWRPFQGRFGILPMAVGSLGLAVTAILNVYDEHDFAAASGPLAALGIDTHHLKDEAAISRICQRFVLR